MATLLQVSDGLEYSYQEPDTNENGAALVDLDHVSVFENIGQGDVKVLDVPASSGAGGQIQTVKLPNPIPQGHEGTVTVYAIAFDRVGNPSEKGPEVSIPLDYLAPAPPN